MLNSFNSYLHMNLKKKDTTWVTSHYNSVTKVQWTGLYLYPFYPLSRLPSIKDKEQKKYLCSPIIISPKNADAANISNNTLHLPSQS